MKIVIFVLVIFFIQPTAEVRAENTLETELIEDMEFDRSRK